jgi:hypothetical protein
METSFMTFLNFKKTAIGGAILLGLAVPFSSSAIADPAIPVVSSNITTNDVLAAQKAWGDALIQISKDYETAGFEKAKTTATAVIDQAYGYNMGPVLFKPTLAPIPQNFRTTKEGALAYFVGGDKTYPHDKGFALKGWRKVEVKNAGFHLNGDTAMTMSNVYMTDKNGKVTVVDKTWGYKKDDSGKLRIVLHHSSLPYEVASAK